MKKLLLLFVVTPFLLSCSNNGFDNNNPYLPNYNVNIQIDLNLPQYSNLKFVSNAIFIPNNGIRGVFIFNTGSGYNAFDAACPNQTPSNCSTMTIKGINVICPCDNQEYGLFTGQAQGVAEYPLKQYRVEINGTIIRIYN